MSRWFRLYDNLVDDPKIQRLSGEMVKALLNLWCLASQNDGMLPAVDDIAFKLRMKPAKVENLLSVLGECGLIDSDETGLRPHNWNARQFKSDVSNERVKQHRERKRNVTSTVTETPPETEQKQKTETEKKEPTLRVVDDWPSDYGEQFWRAYPRKTEKLAAMKKLATLRKSGIVTFADLLMGVKRYATANINTDLKFVKQPPAWLNAGCWADEIQPGGSNGTRNFSPARRSASADFFAGIAGVAADIAGDDQSSRVAAAEIPLGRFNIDG